MTQQLIILAALLEDLQLVSRTHTLDKIPIYPITNRSASQPVGPDPFWGGTTLSQGCISDILQSDIYITCLNRKITVMK